MKKVYIFTLFFIFFAGVYFAFFKIIPLFLKPETDVTPTTISSSSLETALPSDIPRINFNNYEYAYAYFVVSNPENLILIPNFTEKKTTDVIKKEASCMAGINGGFYDKEYMPLGGFISEGKVYKNSTKNALLDGFLCLNEKNISIGLEELLQARICLQSGPLLIVDGIQTQLTIKQDELARRSVAFLTDKKELAFMTIFDPEAIRSGPNLEDVSLILNLIAKKEHFSIKNAINLDGGNASAIHTDKLTLSEFTGVGSYFCLKK